MILNILTILKRLEDFSKLSTTDKDDSAKAVKFKEELIRVAKLEYEHINDFILEFEELLLSIDVSTFNGVNNTNQNLYFPKHPVFDFLSGETKDYIMMEVSRDTRRDKLIELTKFKDNIFTEINSNYELNYKKIKIIDKPITS